jgi:hypothetical protein
MKRLLALVAGGLGLGALIRRRSRRAPEPSHADDLRAKLAESKAQETAAAPAEPQTVEERRAEVHEQARQAMDDLGPTPTA